MKESNLQLRAAKLLQCRDVLQCIFDLNPIEIDIFRLLTREGPLSAADIGGRIGKDRSTAYRSLRHLQACRISYKETVNLKEGGYKHVYYATVPEKVKEEMETCLSDWYGKILTTVKRFPEDLEVSLENEE